MKCLSLHQPWASAIELGSKLFETRSWKTDYRGPIAIHAAKHVRRCDLEELEADPIWKDALKGAWEPGQLMDKVLPLGAIVAVADLVACVPTITNQRLVTAPKGGYCEADLGNWGSGRWAWALENIQPLLEALPFPGRQGLFTIPPATLAGRPLLGPLGWTVPGSEHSLIVKKMLEKQAQNERILARR